MRLNLSAFALFAATSSLVRGDDTGVRPSDSVTRFASCVGEQHVSLESSSCLISTFLSLTIEDEEFDPAICSPPSIERSIELFGDANRVCANLGNEESSFEDIVPFDAVLLFDGCWNDFCEDVTGTVKKTIIEQAKSSFSQMVSQCNNVEISLDTCVASTSLNIIFEGIAESMVEIGDGNRFLEENNLLMGEICNLPDIDDGAVMEITNQAVSICVESGNETSEEDALQVKDAIKSLFAENSCVETFCKDSLETVIEKIDEGKSAVQGFVTDTLNQCYVDGEGPIPNDSCIMSTSIEWIFQSIIASMDYGYEAEKGNGRFLSYYDSLIANEVCGAVLSMIDPTIFMDIVESAAEYCHDDGKPATEISDVTNAIEMYFGTCLPSQCIASVQGGISALKVMAVEEVSECTGVALSLDSCVVSSSMDLFLMGALSSFGEPTSESTEPFKRRMMDDFEQNGVLNSAEICSLAPMNGESILAIVNGGRATCLENNQTVSDYDGILEAISSLFNDGSCLATLCKEVEETVGDMIQDVEDVITAVNLEQTALEYVFHCANIQVDPLSCVETAFMEETLTHYLNADDEADYQPKNDVRQVRVKKTKKTRKTRRHLSTSTKSPGYDHGYSTKSTSYSTKQPKNYSSKMPSGYYSTKSPSGYYSTKSPKSSTKSPGVLQELCPIQRPHETALLDISQKAVNRCNAEGAMPIAPAEMVRLDSFVQKLLHAKCFEKVCSDDGFIFILSKSFGKIGEICDHVSARSNQGQMFMESLCPITREYDEMRNQPTQAPSNVPSTLVSQAPSEGGDSSASSYSKHAFVPFLAMLAAFCIA
jgi:hypothetical protein